MLRNLRAFRQSLTRKNGWMNIFSNTIRGFAYVLISALGDGQKIANNLRIDYRGMMPVTKKNLGKNYLKNRSVYIPHQNRRERFRNKCKYAPSGSVISGIELHEVSDFHPIWMKNWEQMGDNIDAYQRV